MINVEVPVRTAAAVRQVLFDEQKIYTHDEDTTPERIEEIRGVIPLLSGSLVTLTSLDWLLTMITHMWRKSDENSYT